MAERLLAAGADVNWTPDYSDRTPLAITIGPDTRRQELVNWLRGHGVAESVAVRLGAD
jgi:hypothetical protein